MKSEKKKETNLLHIGRNILQERLFFFIILAILLVLTLILLWPNIIALLTAFALVVLTKPLYNWFEKKKSFKDRPNRITAATIVTFILIIAIPVISFVWIALNQADDLFNTSVTTETPSSEEIAGGIDSFYQSLSAENTPADLQQITEKVNEAMVSFQNLLVTSITGLLSGLTQFFTTAAIILVIMMVLLPKFKKPKHSQIAPIIPFPKDITNLYIEKTQLMIMAMFKGTFLIAIIQGFAMGVVFFIAGVPYVFLLSILSMFLSLLPMIGISLLAWPIGIVLIISGYIWQGIFVIGAFLIVVANIDTALRPVLVPKEVNLNPALVILSVFGGLSLMGIIGLIYGPVIMILFVTSIEVYTKYIMRTDLEPFTKKDGSLNLEKMGLKEKDDGTEDGKISILHKISDKLLRKNTNEKQEE